MALSITLGGNGSWSGDEYAIASASVNEEATPLSSTDTSGAIASLSFGVVEDEDTLLLWGTPFTLTDGEMGVLTGKLTGIETADGAATVTGESTLASLVPERQIPPYYGTLAGMFTALFERVGITTPLQFDASLNATSRIVAMQGWFGSPWDWLKMLCISHQVEIALVGATIQVRKPRTRQITLGRAGRLATSAQRGQAAESVTVVHYDNEYKANSMVYPAGGWSEEMEVYSVNADEVVEVEIPVEVSLMSIQQPICVRSVKPDYVGPSVYTVAGNDGLPIPPALWRQSGGKIEVSIGEDTKTIIVKITGPSLGYYAPFSIAMTSGETEGYSSLRLRGTGVHFAREERVYLTGADVGAPMQDSGGVVDNPTMQNDEQFSTMVLTAVRAFSKPAHSISATGLAAGTVIGSLVGSTVEHRGASFRLRAATISPEGVSWQADSDTTYAQVQSVFAGKTYADIKAARAGMSYAETSLVPLREAAGG